jgi:pilus assembly protein FimV
LNQRSKSTAQFAFRGVAVAVACLWGVQAWAIGLGRLQVQSALGETLRAEIEVTRITAEEAASLRLRVASPEVYRASGVGYNAVLPGTSVQLVQRDGRAVLEVRSERAVLEPFLGLIVEATWASGQLVRDYAMQFDPPRTPPPAASPAAAPVQPTPAASAPSTPEPSTPAPAVTAPVVLAAAAASAPAPVAPVARAEAAPPAAAAAPSAPARPRQGGETVRVVWGDTLSRIARRTAPSGVSLDQMLVALLRANPQAFVDDNMNRLKAGSLLTVPSAAEASQVSPAEARRLILAQSADFNAYRRRLAQRAAPAPVETPARRATGQVQAQVEDRRQGAAAPPERLVLSQGGVKPTSPEAQVSRETERKEANTRIAELSRNVDELKQLGQGAAPASGPALSFPPLAPSARPLPASAPEPASAPLAPLKPPVPAAEVPSGGMLEFLSRSPLVLPIAGVLVLLLSGLALHRLRGRRRKLAEEAALQKSRLSADSFFGASDSQRDDLRQGSGAGGNPASMSYSVSQLDAIGDVDPVAEADVYLAYGRDLQAEEILKEAMRTHPERVAIRSKLLEVYAKRRDIKSFELQALQMFELTGGEGEDWAKAQELGRGLDPDNPLYRPGGTPQADPDAATQTAEAGSTPAEGPAAAPTADAAVNGIDLDLDLGSDTPTRPAGAVQPIAPNVLPDGDVGSSSPRLPDAGGDPQAEAVPAAQTAPVEGDERTQTVLPTQTTAPDAPDDGLRFDLEPTPAAGQTPASVQAPLEPAEAPLLDFGSEPSTLTDGPAGNPADGPLARKLELAEEFRQIGDIEGARDLLEEVVSKADGALKARAQGLLDKLG